MKYPAVLWLVCGATLSFGCDDDDPRRPWDTAIDDNTSVSSIGDEDKRNVCRSLDANLSVRLDLSQLTRLVCLPGAIVRAAGSRSMCEQLVDQCVATNTPPPLLVGARIDQESCVSSLGRCDARIGALESCVNVNVSGVLDLLEALTCSRLDNATLDTARRAMDARNTLTTCGNVSGGCQDLVGDAVVQ